MLPSTLFRSASLYFSTLAGSAPQKLEKILIANRGEIAIRVCETAKSLGIKTVAVYSDVDANAQHVQAADESIYIGNSPPLDSYLNQQNIIDAALKTNAQGIHPGYGFLSENSKFAQKCVDNGIKFIGPTVDAMEKMGNKSAAKDIMIANNVPVVPGFQGDYSSSQDLMEKANEIGYPLLIKAVLGGGGRGMRIVRKESEFLPQLKSAEDEAASAFGDPRVLLERLVERPRHIEVQIFGDAHDNYVHLWERDCSVQRNHQKILEEAPAPNVSQEWREQICNSAVAAARAVKYQGAGTVEFLIDPDRFDDNGNNLFYFMEMNTRLQVEHPVTEAITGFDLVQWQLDVAANKPLPVKQSEIKINGHAIEARIYAEDPNNNFQPCTGTIEHLEEPEESVRFDTGFQENDTVSSHYDAMIAKVIVSGENRRSALVQLENALTQLQIGGISTNVDFCKRCLIHPDFQTGGVLTNFLELNPELFESPQITDMSYLAVALTDVPVASHQIQEPNNPFSSGLGWSILGDRLTHSIALAPTADLDSTPTIISYTSPSDSQLILTKGDVEYKLSNVEAFEFKPNTFDISALVEKDHQKQLVEATVFRKTTPDAIHYDVWFNESLGDCTHFQLTSKSPEWVTKTKAAEVGPATSSPQCKSPMPGQVGEIMVSIGDTVEAGQEVAVVVSMKVNHSVYSEISGIVEQIRVSAGDDVSQNQVLLVLEPTEEKESQ